MAALERAIPGRTGRMYHWILIFVWGLGQFAVSPDWIAAAQPPGDTTVEEQARSDGAADAEPVSPPAQEAPEVHKPAVHDSVDHKEANHELPQHGTDTDAHTVVEPTAHAADHGTTRDVAPPTWSILPFAVLLLCIALFPLFHQTAHWWEHNSSKLLVSVICGLLTCVYYATLYGHGVHDHLTHAVSPAGPPAAITILKNSLLVEYVPFMTLLFSLFVISGGINISGSLQGTPRTNTTIMGIGAVLASLVGTTGAAMVLIRPLLRANEVRSRVAHTVVFFIFVVCNTGGCLLPIGDPPLFLGYLRGVEFFWTLNLLPQWALMNSVLLLIYYCLDTVHYRTDRAVVASAGTDGSPLAIRGQINILLLLLVIGCVALLDPSKPVPGTSFTAPAYLREGLMLALTGCSLFLTRREIRQANSFNYEAILEVGVLFIGIFICMQPPIQILNQHGASLGIDQPWKFYWCTGVLSSFLDNAPTYVVFFETAKTVQATSPLIPAVGIGQVELAAISLGAVFMGAMTYIGNGPNLMVRAIAEKSNVRMPSFFGYMAYSCCVLLPASVILTLIFFR